jgi:hypothetical protein
MVIDQQYEWSKLSLHDIAKACGTDKATHGFCPFYEFHIGCLRNLPIRIVEIGVDKGASIRMWCKYFSNAEVHGIDIIDVKTQLDGAFIHKFDASDPNAFREFLSSKPGWDIIIDDGGHTMRQQQTSFDNGWPHIVPGGTYIIEDLHTSNSLGTDYNPERQPTTINMVTALKNNSKFNSKYITQERINLHRESIDNVEMWMKAPPNSKVYMPRNSTTSIICKKKTLSPQ